MEPTVLAYMAGVIDSDGCITVSRSDYRARVLGDMTSASYQARVLLKQVQPHAVDLFEASFGGYRRLADPTASRGKPLHSWSVHSQAAGRVCRVLLPFLRIKKAQAENALRVCDLSTLRSKAFVVPDVVPGEPMVTMAEAARRLGKSYEVVWQAVRKSGSVPHVTTGRRQVLIPESFLPIWASRPRSPSRDQATTNALEQCFQRAKVLNRVGV